MNKAEYGNFKLADIFRQYPHARDFFSALSLPPGNPEITLDDYFRAIDPDLLEDIGMEREELPERFDIFMSRMAEARNRDILEVASITVIGGTDKHGRPENIRFTMNAGDILCVVGPTGSGKSRLLADIEWMAREDTPTGRSVLVNGEIPPIEWRFSLERKLVAQLSQNMNFVVDMSVNDFIRMHAESRMIENPEETAEFILLQANLLAGEAFSPETPVTSLSGGQSRALMIADTAFLSTSPVILIDEIENAGIDRKKALNLLVKKEKIVIIATHDPILALMGHKRIVIKNGGIREIIEVSAFEKSNLSSLERIDRCMVELRHKIRSGHRIDFDLSGFFKGKQ